MTWLTGERGGARRAADTLENTLAQCTLKGDHVPLRTDAYYRTIATSALSRIDVSEPPVPVDALVASFGIPLRMVSLPQFFTAATVYEDGMPVMIVNAAKPEPERRRAIAHMLGHVLLVLEGESETYPRERQPHDDADVVAQEIMLPTSLVIDQARLWFNDHRYLARLFGVDETEMVARMRALGLLKLAPGVFWDY